MAGKPNDHLPQDPCRCDDVLAILPMLGVRKRSYENVFARLVEAIGPVDAMRRSLHNLVRRRDRAYLLWRDAAAAFDRLTSWARRLVVPSPPLPLDDSRLGDFADMKDLSDDEVMPEYRRIRRRIEAGPANRTRTTTAAAGPGSGGLPLHDVGPIN